MIFSSLTVRTPKSFDQVRWMWNTISISHNYYNGDYFLEVSNYRATLYITSNSLLHFTHNHSTARDIADYLASYTVAITAVLCFQLYHCGQVGSTEVCTSRREQWKKISNNKIIISYNSEVVADSGHNKLFRLRGHKPPLQPVTSKYAHNYIQKNIFQNNIGPGKIMTSLSVEHCRCWVSSPLEVREIIGRQGQCSVQ